MKNETGKNREQTKGNVAVEDLQARVESLQEAVERLSLQLSELSEAGNETHGREAGLPELSQEAAGKTCQCRRCAYMRLPHRSNPHYACTARRSNVEPTWTCSLFRDKRGERMPGADARCGN